MSEIAVNIVWIFAVLSVSTLICGALYSFIKALIEREKAQEELEIDRENYQRQLKSLIAELARVEEDQRRKIAEQLHDRIGSSLATAKIWAEMTLDNIKDGENKENIKKISALLEETIDRARSLVFEISPMILYELGLSSALKWFIEKTKGLYQKKISFEEEGTEKQISDSTKSILFQAVRELIINSIKHSHAEYINVKLRWREYKIEISVEDNGKGFDAGAVLKPNGDIKGFGLFNIRERIGQIGGEVKIDSMVSIGTTVKIITPLSKKNSGKDKIDTYGINSGRPSLVSRRDKGNPFERWQVRYCRGSGNRFDGNQAVREISTGHCNNGYFDARP